MRNANTGLAECEQTQSTDMLKLRVKNPKKVGEGDGITVYLIKYQEKSSTRFMIVKALVSVVLKTAISC